MSFTAILFFLCSFDSNYTELSQQSEASTFRSKGRSGSYLGQNVTLIIILVKIARVPVGNVNNTVLQLISVWSSIQYGIWDLQQRNYLRLVPIWDIFCCFKLYILYWMDDQERQDKRSVGLDHLWTVRGRTGCSMKLCLYNRQWDKYLSHCNKTLNFKVVYALFSNNNDTFPIEIWLT